MNRFIQALLFFAGASVAVAQNLEPPSSQREHPREARSTIQAGLDNSGNAQATAAEQARNVGVSKGVAKLSRDEKSRLARDAIKLDVNPNNSAGVAATARMQTQTTSASRHAGRQNTEIRSKTGQAQLDNELQRRSTP